MADKRISQLVERVTLANNDVFPIVASGATTTNKVTLQTIDDYMQTNLDFGVTSVAMTVPTGLSVTGTPVTSTGTFVVTFTAGYSIPTNAKQTQWDTAYNLRITSATAPLGIASNVISITQSGASSNGYLSSTDWNTFNNKQNALTFGNLTEDTSSVLTITGGTGSVIGSGTTIQVKQATSSQDGFLDSADWTTFNNKQNALSGTGIVKSTGGTITYLTDNTSNWDSAYNDKINSASVTGTTTKTLTLNQQDGGTITTTWTDLDTGTVTSVGVSMPSAFSVANSPITSSGTIAITGAGTISQYIDGTGALRTFPSIIAQATNLVREVYNESGATMTKGTVVYINGGHGNLPTIAKALATGDATSAQTYGVVQSNIGDQSNGYIVVVGDLIDMDTQAFVEGTQLYLSPTTAGEYTSTKQYAPNHLVYVGIVTRSHPTQGIIAVKIQNGYEMDELHNVSAQSPNNNDILQYKTATGLWTKTAGTTSNIAEGSNLYYTDARSRAAISESVTGLDYNSSTGVLSTTTGYAIPTTTSQTNWDAAYNDKINSAAVSGTTTKTLTLTQQDGGTITASWTDINTDAVSSVFGRTGAVVATSGDYNTDQVTEGSSNLYFTNARSRSSISLTTTGTSGAATYNSTTGVLNIPSYVGGVTSVNTLTGAVVLTTSEIAEGTNLYYTDTRARAAITLTTTGTSGAATYSGGVLNIPNYAPDLSGYVTLATTQTITGAKQFNAITTFGSTGGSGLRVYGGSGSNQWDIYLNSTNLRFSDNTGTGSIVFDRPLSGTTITTSANINSGDSITMGGELYFGGITSNRKARAYTTGLEGSATLNYSFWTGSAWSIVSTLTSGGTVNYTGNISAANLSGTNTGDQTNISGNAGSVTNATFYRQFTMRDDRSDGSDYSLISRPTGLYAMTGAGTNGPGAVYLSLIHVANGGDVAFQVAGGYQSDAMYFRGTTALQSGTGYTPWRTVLHSGNYSSYALPLSGGTLTGPLFGTSASFSSTGLFQGNFLTIGSAQGATNVNLVLNGVVNKAQRILFQNSGTDQWLLGAGAASETSAFELYNASGTIAISVDKGNSATTFATKISVRGGTDQGGYYMNYQSDASSRSFRVSSEHLVFGDFVIQKSTTRTGTTYEDLLYFDASKNASFNGYIYSTSGASINLIKSESTNASGYGLFQAKAPTTSLWQWGAWPTNQYRLGISGVGDFVTVGANGNMSVGVTDTSSAKLRVEGGEIRATSSNIGIAMYNTSNNGELASYNWAAGSWIDQYYSAASHIFRLSGSGSYFRVRNNGTLDLGIGSDYNQVVSTNAAFGSGWREIFRIASVGLCTSGRFTLYGTGNGFVHCSQWAWSSTHNGGYGRARLIQLTGGEYSDIQFAMDTTTGGSICVSANFPSSYTMLFTIEKTAGGNIDLGNINSDRTSAPSGFTRVQTLYSIPYGSQVYKLIAENDVVAYSDAKLKTNVKTIDNALNKVLALRGVSYNRIDIEQDVNRIGVIAQEVQEVLPEVVTNSGDTLGVSYGNMVGVLIEAMKEQQKQIEELKNLVHALTK